jgi:hypothetical protein
MDEPGGHVFFQYGIDADDDGLYDFPSFLG